MERKKNSDGYLLNGHAADFYDQQTSAMSLKVFKSV